jgi:murein DD-endopeptidase MepM/ murein hydrolase activator NlpD
MPLRSTTAIACTLLLAPAAIAEPCGTADFNGDIAGLRLGRPATGPIAAGFGMQMHPLLRVQKQHYGVDFAGSTGDLVMAPAKGQIAFAGRKGEYGNAITIDHGRGLVTVYGQLSGFVVQEIGECVEAGAAIGYIGSTGLSSGPQLHFEVIVDGKHLDPAPIVGEARP